MARRATLNVFGVSMLDTITCGLAGGIVLLLALASLAKPLAETGFTQSAGGKSFEESSSNLLEARTAPVRDILIAAIYIDYDGPVTGGPSIEPCDGQAEFGPEVRVIGESAADHAITARGQATQLGAVIRFRGATQLVGSPECIDLHLPDPVDVGCRYSVVGDAHSLINQAATPCPTLIQLGRVSNIYKLWLAE